jgi:HEPN domain-containing protein
MTQDELVKFWLNSSLDDFETAKAMFAAHRYNYTMFMCQQSLEELLKAVIVIQTSDQPPFLHDLVLLSKKIHLALPNHIQQNLRNINPHYIVARYKPQRFDPKVYNRTAAKHTVRVTEETIKWFTKKMGLRKYSANL